jgi:PAS domain S-box-containing protein
MTDHHSKNLIEIHRLRRENEKLTRSLGVLSEALEKLEKRETTWLNIIDGNRDGFWDWDCSNNEVFFSKRWKEMLGFREDEISNNLYEWKNRLHPDDRKAVIENLDRHINGETAYYENEYRLQCKDGFYKWILDRGKVVCRDQHGKPLKIVGTQRDITLEREIEIENHHLIEKLGKALDRVNLLNGLLPICSHCKKIRDDKGYWNQIENYIRKHSEAEFSHSICPECIRQLYPGYRTQGR